MNNMDEYMACLDVIAQANHIEAIEDDRIDYDAITSNTVVVDSDDQDAVSGEDDYE